MRRIILLTLFTAVVAGCGKADWDNSTSSQSPSNAVIPSLAPDGPGEILVQLRWQANADSIAGYIVYYGPSADQTSVQVSDLSPSSAGFNPQSPSVTYNSRRDLGLHPGSNVCFRLRAYNSQQALSPWSAPACATI